MFGAQQAWVKVVELVDAPRRPSLTLVAALHAYGIRHVGTRAQARLPVF